MKNLSIYLHLPFCVRKCRYCDFLSFPAKEEEIADYIELLLAEIDYHAPFYQEYQVISVFLGGGTPSLLAGEQIEKILCKLKRCFLFVPEPEITIEVNPGTVTEEKLTQYFRTGINRLSIGLQSAQDKELRCLGRIHDYAAFCTTYEAARKAGFRNINVDLMAAIPNQTKASYVDTLHQVIAWQPEHISAYSLILEEGTWFYEHQKELSFPDEELDRELYEITGRVLAQHGYERYEISNYAKAGFACKHNQVYWERGEYLGIGLGAASLVDEVRFSNHRTMAAYRDALSQAQDTTFQSQNVMRQARTALAETTEYLTRQDQMAEFMFLGLRLTKGVVPEAFFEKFGVSIETVYGQTLEKLQKEGLLVADKTIRLTPYGMDISNYVMAQFLL